MGNDVEMTPPAAPALFHWGGHERITAKQHSLSIDALLAFLYFSLPHTYFLERHPG